MGSRTNQEPCSKGRAASAARRGLTLVEACLATLVVAIVMLISTNAISASMKAVGQARTNTRAAIFLETVMEDVSAQPYENLLALNGNQIIDEDDLASSHYSVDLTVFLAEVDLLQVDAVLTDLRTNKPMGRLTTLRSNR